MAAKQQKRTSNRGGERNKKQVAPYYKRLDPTHEFEYGAELTTKDGDTFRAFEVTIFDDRDDIGQRQPGIIIQFRKTGKYGATATLTLPEDGTDGDAADALDELLSDLQTARDEL